MNDSNTINKGSLPGLKEKPTEEKVVPQLTNEEQKTQSQRRLIKSLLWIGAIVVIFGTLSMFLYPILYRAGIFDLSPDMMGLFTGSAVHEVAHVVGAANAMGAEVSNNAIIVKMIRVMMLVPVLLVIAWTVARDVAKRDCLENTDTNKPKISIPWFAILFLEIIGLSHDFIKAILNLVK